jgi:hypothetical protein
MAFFGNLFRKSKCDSPRGSKSNGRHFVKCSCDFNIPQKVLFFFGPATVRTVY